MRYSVLFLLVRPSKLDPDYVDGLSKCIPSKGFGPLEGCGIKPVLGKLIRTEMTDFFVPH